MASYFAYTRYRIAQKHIKAELERKNLETEQRLLRTQMNPHFIFNSLNAINSFIGSNEAEAARTYLTKFSLLMRLILQNSRIALISLADELNTIQLYLELEKLRFESAFNFVVDCALDIDVDNTYVPPMLVQPFVENALLHGIAHRKGGGLIQIRFTRQSKAIRVVVTDNGVGRTRSALIENQDPTKKPSLGMQLTSERLASLSHQYKDSFKAIITDVKHSDDTVIGTNVELTMPFETE
jgi:LytS/YehU family sensor histidine kinase